MKLTGPKVSKLTLVSVAAYVLVFAVCAKGIYYYANQYPPKEELLAVQGVVEDVRLGGQGSATRLTIESAHGTHQYSSYYGIVWPGMEGIQPQDRVELLAEKNRLNKNEWLEGKSYYIWELLHRDKIIIRYEDVLELVQEKEAIVDRFIDLWLVASLLFLLVAYLRKIILVL